MGMKKAELIESAVLSQKPRIGALMMRSGLQSVW